MSLESKCHAVQIISTKAPLACRPVDEAAEADGLATLKGWLFDDFAERARAVTPQSLKCRSTAVRHRERHKAAQDAASPSSPHILTDMATYLTLPSPKSLPTHDTGFSPDKSVEVQAHAVAQHWLTNLEIACREKDAKAFRNLFAEDGFWRDVMAFTSDFRSIRGANIEQAAKVRASAHLDDDRRSILLTLLNQDRLGLTDARNFVFSQIQPSLSDPFPDVTFLNLHANFETSLGPSYLVANLVYKEGEWQAYTVFTLLEGIHGHPMRVGADRFRGTHNDQESYDERRARECEYKDRDPDTLVIGGGHNGLAVAAQLKALGNDALVVDTFKRVGDNWRLRYSSLSLQYVCQSLLGPVCSTDRVPAATLSTQTTSRSSRFLPTGPSSRPPASSPTSSSTTSRSSSSTCGASRPSTLPEPSTTTRQAAGTSRSSVADVRSAASRSSTSSSPPVSVVASPRCRRHSPARTPSQARPSTRASTARQQTGSARRLSSLAHARPRTTSAPTLPTTAST